jgi:phage tail protein X
MTAADTVIVSAEGLTLDLLVWRRFRRRTPGLVEQAFDLNPGLAARGELLPLGAAVRLPAAPSPTAATPTTDVIRLWE